MPCDLGRLISIDVLPNEALLEIFHIYVDKALDLLPVTKKGIEAWQSVVHMYCIGDGEALSLVHHVVFSLFDTLVSRFQATNTSGCMTSDLENEHEKAGHCNSVSDTLNRSIRRN